MSDFPAVATNTPCASLWDAPNKGGKHLLPLPSYYLSHATCIEHVNRAFFSSYEYVCIFLSRLTRPAFYSKAAAWDRGEDNIERRFDNGVQDFENLPQDAARWTGEAVGDVEAVPDRIEHGVDRAEDHIEDGFEDAGRTVEHGWDETVDAVEDAPENLAETVGEGVGKVEGFGDSIENFGDELETSYDQGRDDARYD